MARSTPDLDAARELVDGLTSYLALPSALQVEPAPGRYLEAQVAIAQSLLAVAEALHGVVYVANANAV